MSEDRHVLLEPIFVRVYPPFALAMGMSFLSWLMGSLAFDSLLGTDRDALLGILFGLIFLAALVTALVSWTSLLAIRRLGLHMDHAGVVHVQPGLLRTHTRSLAWQDVSGIELEKGALLFETEGEPLRLVTSGMLENPHWILERARAWLKAVKNSEQEDKTVHRLSNLEAELEGVVCQSCGGGIEIRLASKEKAVCSFCGDTQSLSEEVKGALKRLSIIIAELPAAHRQFQEKTLRRFVERGSKQRRILLGVGWSTAAIWLLFALVELISSAADKEARGLDFPFLGILLGLAVFSVMTTYLLGFFIRSAAGRFSLPMQALAPLESDGRARCRLCGAELPEKGILRRCHYCQSDSVVVGSQLAAAERAARESLRQARSALNQGTETAGRLLHGVAARMQFFAYSQFFWLHVPIVLAMEGSTGMLYRITGIFLAMLLGNLASAILGMRWISRYGLSNKKRDEKQDGA